MKNSKDFIHFVLLPSPNGKIRSHYTFSGYTDLEGNIIEYHEGAINSKTGRPEPADFHFSRRHRAMPVHKNAHGKDREGNRISKTKFLRDNPECEGSPNNTGQQCWYKEMNTDKDVDIALQAGETRREAEGMAAALSGGELKSAAALYSETSDSVKKQKFAVLQAAFHDPEDFIKKISSDDFKIRGFIIRCLAHGVFTKSGTILRWGTTTIGVDEDEAVKKLLLDEDVSRAVKKQLSEKEGDNPIEEEVRKEIEKAKIIDVGTQEGAAIMNKFSEELESRKNKE